MAKYEYLGRRKREGSSAEWAAFATIIAACGAVRAIWPDFVKDLPQDGQTTLVWVVLGVAFALFYVAWSLVLGGFRGRPGGDDTSQESPND